MPVKISSITWIILLKLKRLLLVKYKYHFSIFSLFIFFLVLLKLYCEYDLPSNSYDKRNNWIMEHRNLSSFLYKSQQEESHIACKEETFLLISVISSPLHFDARDAIRNSWARNLPPSWMIIFFVGKSKEDYNKDRIHEEMNMYKDVIELDIEESYMNLTLKVSLMLDWTNQNCKQSKFLLKSDDDIYINIKNMEHFLDCCSFFIDNLYDPNIPLKCKRWNSNIVGHYVEPNKRKYFSYIAAGYLYKGVKPDRNPSSKWYLSPKLYEKHELPNFLSGTSYLISTGLIKHVLAKAIQTPLIHLEDVYITGMVMKDMLNLKLSHIDGWSNFRPQWDDACLYKTLLTAHGLNPHEMLTITKAVATIETTCSTFDMLLSYFNNLYSYYFPRYLKTI